MKTYIKIVVLLLFFVACTFTINVDSNSAGGLPILSDYTTIKKINGQKTSVRNIQVAISDLNDQGVFSAGTSTVELDAHNFIEYLYPIDEISAIPFSVGKGIAKASECADLDVFANSAAINGQFYNQVVNGSSAVPGIYNQFFSNATLHQSQPKSRGHSISHHSLTIKKHEMTRYEFPTYVGGGSAIGAPRRALLQFGIGAALGAAALGLAVSNRLEIDKMKGQMNVMEGRITNNENQIVNVQGFVDTLTRTTNDLAHNLTLQTDINKITADALNTTRTQIGNITDALNATNYAIAQLNQDVTDKFNDVVNGTKLALARLQSNFNSSFATIYNELAILYSLQSNATQNQIDSTNRFTTDIVALGRQLRSSLSMAWDAAQGVSTERSLVESLFEAAANIPDGTFILKTQDGTPPHQGALNGTFSRFFIERVTINWIEVSDVTNQNGILRAFREDYTIWVDTMLGIHNDKPWNTWDDIISLMGPDICLRPYTDADFGLDTVDVQALATNAPGCKVWIETHRTSCELDPVLLPGDFTLEHSGALDATVCKAGSTTPRADDKKVQRNLLEFNKYIGDLYSNADRKQAGNTLLVQLQRLGGRSIVQGPKKNSDAYIPWNVAQRVLDYQSLQTYINAGILLSFPYIQADLKDRDQFIFGRAFDGTDESPCPISDAPTRREYDPDTQQLQIVYDGGAKKTRCKQLEFRYVSEHLVPLNAAQPYSIQPYRTNIKIKTVTPVNGSTTIPITKTDVQTSISFNVAGSQLLPKTLFFVGSLDPDEYGVIWDIPDKQICGINSYDSCKGKVDLYQSPAGTRLTPQLAQWVNASSDRTDFHPRDMGDSISTYLRPFIFDDEGYPQCNVPGGVSPVDILKNKLTGGFKPSCRGSFDWYEGTVNNQENPLHNSQGVKCNGMIDPGTLWFIDNGILSDAVSASSGSPSILLQPWSFSFQYRTTLSVYPILSLVTSTVKLTIVGGANLIITINNNSGGAVTIPVHHQVESTIHNVWIQWDAVSSNTLTVFVDFQKVYSSTGFSIATTTGLGTVNTTITNTNYNILNNRIFAVRYYNAIYDDTTIKSFGGCHASKVLPNRCDIPTDSLNSPLPDTRSIVRAYQVPAPGCYPVTESILLTDPIDTKNINLLASGNPYTLTWWSDRVDFSSSSSFTPMLSLGGYLISLSTSAVKFTLLSDTSTISTYNFGSLASGLSIASTNAHFFTLVSSPSALDMYIDKIKVTPDSGSGSGSYPSLGSSGNIATSVIFYPQFTMGRFYRFDSLNSAQITTAFNCELSASTVSDTASWRTPLATCIVSPFSVHQAYCRHASMCSGKCSTYTVSLDLQHGTYYADSLQCDPFYEGTSCSTLCPRTTPNGYCLADTDPYKPLVNNTSFQSIPGSEVCNLLRHFKASVFTLDNGQKMLSLIPRKMDAVISFEVPQGDIIQDIATGECPQVSSNAFNNSLLGFKLVNNANVDTTIKVIWTSTAPTIDLDDPSCFDFFNLDDGTTMTINANYYKYFKTPPCQNTQIQIQRLIGPDQWENCGSPIDSSSFPDIISTSVLVPENVVTALVIAKDETFQAMNALAIAGWINDQETQIQSAIASGAGQARIDSIRLFQQHLQNVSSSAAASNQPLNYDDLLNGYVNGTVGGQTFKDYLKQSSDVAAATSDSAKNRDDINLIVSKNKQLNDSLYTIMTVLNILTINESASLAEYIQKVKDGRDAQNKADNASGGGGFNPFDALGDAANWVGGSLIPGLGNFLGGTLGALGNLIGGGLGGLFGGLGTWLETVIEYIIVFVIAYLLFKWYMTKKGGENMRVWMAGAQKSSPKYLTDAEESVPLTHHQQQQQQQQSHTAGKRSRHNTFV